MYGRDVEYITTLLERRSIFAKSIPADRVLFQGEPYQDRLGLWSARVDYESKSERPIPSGRITYTIRLSTRITVLDNGLARYSTFKRGKLIEDEITPRYIGISLLDRAAMRAGYIE